MTKSLKSNRRNAVPSNPDTSGSDVRAAKLWKEIQKAKETISGMDKASDQPHLWIQALEREMQSIAEYIDNLENRDIRKIS